MSERKSDVCPVCRKNFSWHQSKRGCCYECELGIDEREEARKISKDLGSKLKNKRKKRQSMGINN